MTRRAAALLVAVLLAVASGFSASTAIGMPDAAVAPGATVPFADAATGVALDLAAYGPAVLTPGDELGASVVVANTTPVAKSGLNVVMRVTARPLATSGGLSRFIEDPSGYATQEAARKPVTSASVIGGVDTGVLPPAGTVAVTVAATPAELGMPAKTEGVYGVVISVVGPAGVLATRTAAVTWYDASISPLHVAFVATASGSPERVARVAAASDVSGAALALDPVQVIGDAQADQRRKRDTEADDGPDQRTHAVGHARAERGFVGQGLAAHRHHHRRTAFPGRGRASPATVVHHHLQPGRDVHGQGRLQLARRRLYDG